MRKIKFRAWDKEKNVFLDLDWNDYYIDMDTGEVYEIEERSKYYQTYMHKRFISVELQQYTGLKDMNGKEIYEGDVVRIPDLYETPENTSTTYHNSIVTFENAAYQMGGYPMYEDARYISDSCEVIGNIYENPELLTKED